jgi:hypothetical protein
MSGMPRGWMLKAIIVNGIDATDRPLDFGRSNQSVRDVEIVLTDRVSVVAGRVVDGDGRALAATRVAVFSDDRSRWFFGSRYLASTTTSDDGAFSIEGVPAGTYNVAPLGAVAGGRDAWQDPAVLGTLATRAMRVTIRDGQTLNVTLRADGR